MKGFFLNHHFFSHYHEMNLVQQNREFFWFFEISMSEQLQVSSRAGLNLMVDGGEKQDSQAIWFSLWTQKQRSLAGG